MKKVITLVVIFILSIFTLGTSTLAQENPNKTIDDKDKILEVAKDEPTSDIAFEIGGSINSLLKYSQLSTELSLTGQDLLKSEKERTLTMKATAYTANCDGCSGVTKTGIDLLENPDKKVVAVDPNVIPLGTKLYVEGYGKAVAGDIGSAIKGNRIDLFIPSEAEANKWGVQEVEVTILK
ncbi:3D (Asp-Asp-Asp) domain-containing protein [Salinibacillus kushneri]|uniref:3D (Asp-Asp-Asp) domain-containing protein n=1 Tax=Salinibacillus kushneri TaxID=237682 RepID=A0A1I0BC59_9BACI|nr:3D domain-containing protein [Salinibacillus kushneri]SET04438.1 3D (Asp-Asp-Asp) domain-containing protein [Salinibacillus kushneri]